MIALVAFAIVIIGPPVFALTVLGIGRLAGHDDGETR